MALGGAASGAAAGSAFGPWGTVAGAGVGALASVFGAKEQSSASSQATAAQTQAQQAALQFAKEQAALAQTNYGTAQNANYNQWAYQQANLRPYNAIGQGAAQGLAGLLGVTPAPLAGLPAPPSYPGLDPNTGQPTPPPTQNPYPSGALGVQYMGPSSAPTTALMSTYNFDPISLGSMAGRTA